MIVIEIKCADRFHMSLIVVRVFRASVDAVYKARSEDPADDGTGTARRYLPHRIRLHLPGPDPDGTAADHRVLRVQQVHHRRRGAGRRQGISPENTIRLPSQSVKGAFFLLYDRMLL